MILFWTAASSYDLYTGFEGVSILPMNKSISDMLVPVSCDVYIVCAFLYIAMTKPPDHMSIEGISFNFTGSYEFAHTLRYDLG
jgi:hypothetical protein